MNFEALREYCLSLKDATEDMPFEDDYLTFRIFNKWFAVIPMYKPELKIFVKCDPEQALELRGRYDCVEAAWHFNKKYWNMITINEDMDDETVKHWIRHSLEEVLKKLPKKIREEYRSDTPKPAKQTKRKSAGDDSPAAGWTDVRPGEFFR